MTRSADQPERSWPEIVRVLSDTERMYSADLDSYGPTARAVGWKDESSQLLRFQHLARVLSPAPPGPITVNDLGCGYGAMFTFLERMPTVELARYHGYDVSDSMLRAARAETDARAVLHLSPCLTEHADFSFASGTFYLKGDTTDAIWQKYVEDKVLEMAAHSRLGFAFNLLTTYVDYRTDGLFYADPADFFSFCKQRVSPYVALLHDYPLWEWTILVRHPDGGSQTTEQPSPTMR